MRACQHRILHQNHRFRPWPQRHFEDRVRAGIRNVEDVAVRSEAREKIRFHGAEVHVAQRAARRRIEASDAVNIGDVQRPIHDGKPFGGVQHHAADSALDEFQLLDLP